MEGMEKTRKIGAFREYFWNIYSYFSAFLKSSIDSLPFSSN